MQLANEDGDPKERKQRINWILTNERRTAQHTRRDTWLPSSTHPESNSMLLQISTTSSLQIRMSQCNISYPGQAVHREPRGERSQGRGCHAVSRQNWTGDEDTWRSEWRLNCFDCRTPKYRATSNSKRKRNVNEPYASERRVYKSDIQADCM